MRDSPCFTIFSSVALVKTPSRHKITIRKLVWICLCRFRGTASLPITEGSVKTWKLLYVQFGTCGDIFISTLRGCARNSNFDTKELKEYAAVTEVTLSRLFCLLAVPADRSRALKFAPSTKMTFGRQYQRLYQLGRANYNHKESRATNIHTG